ncbi:MAG: peptide chain release factor-like protein, partial [Bacteroidota bacterium]
MDRAIIARELAFRTSRSGGKGGQHVNKVETRVELLFSFPASAGLSAAEKALAVSRLATYLDSEQRMHLFSDRFRTQLANKRAVTERFFALLEPALV